MSSANRRDDGSTKLTRAQRRQMQKLADAVDRVTRADRLFFERRPDRKHRVLITSKVEIEQQELISGAVLWCPPPCRLFTVVRNIAPGVRLCLIIRGVEGGETDVSEETARSLFEGSATPYTWIIETKMRQAAEARA